MDCIGKLFDGLKVVVWFVSPFRRFVVFVSLKNYFQFKLPDDLISRYNILHVTMIIMLILGHFKRIQVQRAMSEEDETQPLFILSILIS